MRKKLRTTTSTINPLYDQGEYKTITITDSIQQQKYNLSYNLSQDTLPLNVFWESGIILDSRQSLFIQGLEVQDFTPRGECQPLRRLCTKANSSHQKAHAHHRVMSHGHPVSFFCTLSTSRFFGLTRPCRLTWSHHADSWILGHKTQHLVNLKSLAL